MYMFVQHEISDLLLGYTPYSFLKSNCHSQALLVERLICGQIYNFDLKSDKPNSKHGIKIHGPAELKSGNFDVRDLRHGASLIMAAMTAQGVSVIKNIQQIDRGYEDLDLRLSSMGAKIERLD